MFYRGKVNTFWYVNSVFFNIFNKKIRLTANITSVVSLCKT